MNTQAGTVVGTSGAGQRGGVSTPAPRPYREHAHPGFLPAVGARDAADRWFIRRGYRPRNWPMHDRVVALFRANDGRPTALPPRETRAVASWQTAILGPAPAMVRAVRLVRRSRTLAMYAVGLRAFHGRRP